MFNLRYKTLGFENNYAQNNDEYRSLSKLFKDQNKHRSKNTKYLLKIKG